MMSIIENHILSIVNNNDGINAFYENYLEHDKSFNEYLEEIEFDANFDFTSYQFDWDIYKYEIMNELYGDLIKEQFFNNVIRTLDEDLTDADKHIIVKYLIGQSVKSYCDVSRDCINDAYYDDEWQSLICSYVYLKVHNMILGEEQWLQISIIDRIQDCVRDKLKERTIRNIAINKIKRNEIFNLGLGLKLSMRDCGIPVGA